MTNAPEIEISISEHSVFPSHSLSKPHIILTTKYNNATLVEYNFLPWKYYTNMSHCQTNQLTIYTCPSQSIFWP